MSTNQYDEHEQEKAREALEEAVRDALAAGLSVAAIKGSVEYVLEIADLAS